jgi:hypothetical protein
VPARSDTWTVTDQTNPAGVPPYRSALAQVGALAGSFLAAIALGSIIGWMVQPEGEAVGALLSFALLLVFIGGMALWGALAASIMARVLFNGDFALALLRFFLRGRLREDVPRLNLNRAVIVAAAVRAMAWSRVFVWLAIGVAIVAAPLAGWFATRGFTGTVLLTTLVIVSYGASLRALAQGGYLLPPDVDG